MYSMCNFVSFLSQPPHLVSMRLVLHASHGPLEGVLIFLFCPLIKYVNLVMVQKKTSVDTSRALTLSYWF